MYSVEWEENNINMQRTFETIEDAEEYEESIKADAEFLLQLKINFESIRIIC